MQMMMHSGKKRLEFIFPPMNCGGHIQSYRNIRLYTSGSFGLFSVYASAREVGGGGGMEGVPWLGFGKGKEMQSFWGNVCRFADLQQLHEFTQVIGGEFTRVLRAVDEEYLRFTQFTRLFPPRRGRVFLNDVRSSPTRGEGMGDFWMHWEEQLEI